MGRVDALAWSPDGQRIASTSRSDMAIVIWDVRSGRPERTLTSHTQGIRSITWSPDGMRLASSGYDRTIRIWDASTGVQARTRTWEDDSTPTG